MQSNIQKKSFNQISNHKLYNQICNQKEFFKYDITNDAIKYQIINDKIKNAITNVAINKNSIIFLCFQIRLRNSRSMFRACFL